MRLPLTTLLVLAIAGLTGCDDGSDGTDGGETDAGGEMLSPSALFEPCVADEQCPGATGICRTAADGFPGGYCTTECTDRTPCDDGFVYNHCISRDEEAPMYCERRCLNGIDCGREGWSCLLQYREAGGDVSGYCIPVCATDEDCGGASCNAYTGECTDEPLPTTGALTGEPCSNDDICRSGQCVEEAGETGVPTGWIGGYCLGNCILPDGYNEMDFFDGTELPNGGCPDEGVCLPPRLGVRGRRGDLGTCYDACTEDTQCRGGYTCLKSFGGGMFNYPNGVCVPDDCVANGCPSGYACVEVMGASGPRSVCGPT